MSYVLENRLDSHTHTVASGHAYNTVIEMAKAASEKKLELLAITDHAIAIPGSTCLFYFENLKVLPRKMFDIHVIFGAELNILDSSGAIDLEEKQLRCLDLCIASMHTVCIRPGSIEENTRGYVNAMKNRYVNIIGHPDDGRFPVDFDELARAAKDEHVLLEMNNHSLDEGCSRLNARDNALRMLDCCVKYGTHIILDSDAHWCSDVGNDRNIRPLLEETDFPAELVVNRDLALYAAYINRPEMIWDPSLFKEYP